MNTSDSPYQVGVASTPITHQTDIAAQLKMKDEDEKNSKAPPILPDPLDKLIPILGNVFVSLLQARSLLSQASQNPSAKGAELDVVICKLDNINAEILDLSATLSILSI